MSIQDTYEFDNRGEVVRHPFLKSYFLAITMVLLAVLSFGLGKLSSLANRPQMKIEYEPIDSAPGGASTASQSAQVASVVNATQASLRVYASSKGTKYYYDNCKSTVSEKNKIFFISKDEAEKAGYTLAANCKP